MSRPAAVCAASANAASKAKFRTNLRIHILSSLWSTCLSYLRKRASGPHLAANGGLPSWRGPGINLSNWGFPMSSATWADKYHVWRHHSMCSQLGNLLTHMFHRSVASVASDGCQHRQPHALLAPTPRVKRNFGLTSESTYLSSL